MGNINPSGNSTHKLILWINLIIMLFPPVHLYMVRGDLGMAMLFFMGSSIILILSVIYMHRASPDSRED